MGDGNVAGFFAYNDGECVGCLGYAEGGAVA